MAAIVLTHGAITNSEQADFGSYPVANSLPYQRIKQMVND
jgi:hypothetical protein